VGAVIAAYFVLYTLAAFAVIGVASLFTGPLA